MRAQIVDWYTGKNKSVEFDDLAEWIDTHGKAVIVRPPSPQLADYDWVIFTSDNGRFGQR